MLSILFDHKKTGLPFVTIIFASELLNCFFANFIFSPVSMKFSVDINRSITPGIFGDWRGNVLFALILGNTFHIQEQSSDLFLRLFGEKNVQEKLMELEILGESNNFNRAKMDKIAIGASLIMPIFLITILMQVITGRISYQS